MVTIPSNNVFVIFPQILLFYTSKIYEIKWRVESIIVILCLNVFLLQISFGLCIITLCKYTQYISIFKY